MKLYFLLIALLKQSPDTLSLPHLFFSKCINEGISNRRFWFAKDSTVQYREFAEGWVSTPKHSGTWHYEKGIIFWCTNPEVKTYRIDKIRELNYMFAQTDSNKIEDIKARLLKCILDNPAMKDPSISDFPLYALIDLEYSIASDCTCGLDVLVEVPPRFLRPSDYERYHDPKTKQKRKKQSN